MSSNSNDALVALMLVLTLLVIRWPAVRGVSARLAGFTKFAPLALGPLFLRGTGPVPAPRSIVKYVLAYALTFAAVFAPVALKHDLGRSGATRSNIRRTARPRSRSGVCRAA